MINVDHLGNLLFWNMPIIRNSPYKILCINHSDLIVKEWDNYNAHMVTLAGEILVDNYMISPTLMYIDDKLVSAMLSSDEYAKNESTYKGYLDKMIELNMLHKTYLKQKSQLIGQLNSSYNIRALYDGRVDSSYIDITLN